MATALIMVIGLLFWVVYTLVFFFSTKGWSKEDSDYMTTSEPPSARVDPGEDA